MVRTYIKKRTRPEIVEEDMNKAMNAVIQEKMPLRHAAEVYGVTYTTLFYRVKKAKSLPADTHKPTYSSKYTFRQVFTTEQEVLLEEYILKSSKINYGMTYIQIRKLAFQYATKLGCSFPMSWQKSNCAGIDWMKGFMTRHNNLSLRKPENTSLSRSTSFNKANVTEFQDNLSKALQKHNFTGDRIINLDETGVTTVVQAPNVVAQMGIKQVGQAVSAERGTLITMCAIVTASGNTIPPVFIFPRARMHESLMNGAPPGSLGLANSPKSGWMTALLFVKTLEHIQKHTRCSKEDPILVLMDNHESHCSLEAVIYAKENGITLLTFPPHCTHRLQPLDVSVMGPFKAKLMVAFNDWMIANPGRTITVHDLAALANKAFTISFTMGNIISGFKKTGICPFSRTVFSDEDFEPAFVTDQPVAVNSLSFGQQEQLDLQMKSRPIIFPSTSNVTPEAIRPYPKAKPRSSNRGGRKKVHSRILTDTPEKVRIEAEAMARLAKKMKQPIKSYTSSLNAFFQTKSSTKS